ncbi:MAG: hypothetical protein Q8L78_06780 [Coxiellaceae bacterium]|nr:hypothetical protein [Coxiellaceae bacterium]
MPTLSAEEQAFLLNQGVSENALQAIRGKYNLNASCYRYIPSFIQHTSEEIFKRVLYMHDDVPDFILSQTQSPEILNELIKQGISLHEVRSSVWNLDGFRRLYRHYNDFVQISQETGIPFRRIYEYGMKCEMPIPATLFNNEMLAKRDQSILNWLCREFEIPNTLLHSLDENKRAIVVDHSMGMYHLLIQSVRNNIMSAVQLIELPDFLALKSELLSMMLIHACDIQVYKSSDVSWKTFLNLDDQIRILLLENSWEVTKCIKLGIKIDRITCLNVLQVKQLLALCGERDLNNQEILAEIKDFIDTAHLQNSSTVIMRQVESQRSKMAKKQMPLAGLFQLNFEVREHMLQFTGSETMSESDKRQLILGQLTLH